jgi:hypothetical protein
MSYPGRRGTPTGPCVTPVHAKQHSASASRRMTALENASIPGGIVHVRRLGPRVTRICRVGVSIPAAGEPTAR